MNSNQQRNDESGFIPPIDDRPGVTVDVVIFSLHAGNLYVLLIKRTTPPYQDRWALPGGFVLPNESLEAAAERKLMEETGVKADYSEQLYTFGAVLRDPRMRIITVAYFALVPFAALAESPAADISLADISLNEEKRDGACWVSFKELPDLAFDHRQIVEYAHQRLRYKLEYTAIGFQLLPDIFTLTQLQRAYETVLDEPLDKRNFRRKILAADVIEETGEKTKEGEGRPAKLYRYKSDAFMEIKSRRLFP